MKITIYELLGMIKDGKTPKKIKYHNYICYYDDGDYKLENGSEWLFANEYIDLKYLNEEVEILEEEKKIPEKSNIDFNTKLPVSGCSENEAFMMTCISHLGNTIDKIIDYLKSKGE